MVGCRVLLLIFFFIYLILLLVIFQENISHYHPQKHQKQTQIPIDVWVYQAPCNEFNNQDVAELNMGKSQHIVCRCTWFKSLLQGIVDTEEAGQGEDLPSFLRPYYIILYSVIQFNYIGLSVASLRLGSWLHYAKGWRDVGATTRRRCCCRCYSCIACPSPPTLTTMLHGNN